MNVAVLGAGMIGTTVVQELIPNEGIDTIYVVDGLEKSIQTCVNQAHTDKVKGKYVQINGEKDIYEALKAIDADLAIACLPHALSMLAIQAAIDAQCHIVDLVGSLFEEKKALHEKAK